MSLKTISITLPEKMIQAIDAMLHEKDFTSRSDFFRHLFRMWQVQLLVPVGNRNKEKSEESHEFAEVDLEYGIPPEVIKRLEEKVKL